MRFASKVAPEAVPIALADLAGQRGIPDQQGLPAVEPADLLVVAALAGEPPSTRHRRRFEQ